MSPTHSLRIRGRIELGQDGLTAVLRDAADRSFFIEDERSDLLPLVGQEVEVLGTLRGGAGCTPHLRVEAVLSTGRRRTPRYPSGLGWR